MSTNQPAAGKTRRYHPGRGLMQSQAYPTGQAHRESPRDGTRSTPGPSTADSADSTPETDSTETADSPDALDNTARRTQHPRHHHPQWFRLTRLHALRTRRKIHSHRHISLAYRWTVGVVGGLLIVVGLVAVPLPGPGWLIVFSGIAVVSTEFAWAHRLLHWARTKLQAWKNWLVAQHWTVSAGVSVLTCAFVCACVWTVLHFTGLPAWVPDWVAHATLLG